MQALNINEKVPHIVNQREQKELTEKLLQIKSALLYLFILFQPRKDSKRVG